MRNEEKENRDEIKRRYHYRVLSTETLSNLLQGGELWRSVFLYASEMCQLLTALLKLYSVCRLYAVYIEPIAEYFKCVFFSYSVLLYSVIILWSRLQLYKVLRILLLSRRSASFSLKRMIYECLNWCIGSAALKNTPFSYFGFYPPVWCTIPMAKSASGDYSWHLINTESSCGWRMHQFIQFIRKSYDLPYLGPPLAWCLINHH